MADMSACVCSYCHDNLEGGPTNNMSLKCGHTFHKECVKKDWIHKHTTVEELRCPVCKMTAGDMSLLEQQLFDMSGGHPSIPPNMTGSPIDLDAVTNPAPSPAVSSSNALDAVMDVLLPDPACVATAAAASPAAPPDFTTERPEGSREDHPVISDSADAGDDRDAAAEENEETLQFAAPLLQRSAREGFQITAVPAWDAIMSDTRVLCCDCGEECVKYRILSKVQCRFRCNKCNYVHTRLYGCDGKHAVKALQEGTSARHDFFKKSHVADATEQKRLVTQFTTERRYMLGGGFKPLSVWVAQGYEGERIATHSRAVDVMPDKMFGLLYRVPELYVGIAGSEGTTETTTMGRDRKRPRESVEAAGSIAGSKKVKKELYQEDGEAEGAAPSAGPDSSSSRPSSSSSSSSSKRPNASSKKKKSKKLNKKEKNKMKKQVKEAKKEKQRLKEEALEERQAAKAEEKAAKAEALQEARANKQAESALNAANNKGQAAALSFCKKVDTIMASLQKSLRTPGAVQVPVASKAPMELLLVKFGDMLAEAQGAANGFELGANFSIPEKFASCLVESKKHQALFHLTARTYASADRI